MNRLSTERRAQVIQMLCEGMAMRAINRTTGVARQTISDLLENAGHAASEYQDTALRNLVCRRLECDEIWSFCHPKVKNVPADRDGEFGVGDVWTWTAIDAETKLVPTWLVGERTNKDCYLFLSDLRSRLCPGRIQLTTDGLSSYFQCVEPLFGSDRVDFAQLVKQYGGQDTDHRYSPAECTGIDVRKVTGDPNPDYISTSYVERQNLTMRMHMRRFTRLTNAFSKKVEFHAYAVSLNFLYYNFARPHQSLRGLKRANGTYAKVTPAMAAGVTEHVWSVREFAALLD